MVGHTAYMFIWSLDHENIGLDPQIMILHEVISEILVISDFEAAFWKMAETSSESHLFLVTSLIWSLRVPWTKWYHSLGVGVGMVGVHGDPR